MQKRKNLKLHLILTSHSPFILSDIPKQNIIFLKDGKQVDALEKKQPETERIVGLAYKALWMAAVAAVSFIAKTVGLI